MKNNLIKIVLVVLTLLILFSNCKVYADPMGLDEYIEDYKEGLEDPTANPNSWKPSSSDEPELLEKAGTVLGVINVIGVVSSVIALMLIGIKYMFGSVEEKAEYKKSLVPYVIGAALVFSATTIPNVIYMFTKGVFK